MAAGILSVKYLVAFLVPDVPEEVEIQLKRQKFITDKVLYDAQDDLDEMSAKKLKVVAEFSIRITDDDPN